MKIKTLLTVLLFSAAATTAVAQDDVCIPNSSVSHEAVKAGNFKEAYGPWKIVLETCPLLRYYTYTDGFKLLKGLLSEQKDRNSADYKKYYDDLMNLHDLRIKYIPEFEAKGTKIPTTVNDAIGLKALDYIQYSPNGIDLNQAYGWLKQSLEGEKENASANVMHYFLEISMQKLKADETHKEQFIKDYLMDIEFADAAIAKTKKASVKKNLEGVRGNLDALFINSGAANCESLQSIYAPKVEANKENLDVLKEVIRVMSAMGCKDSDAYLSASFYAYKMEPSVDAAIGCAAMCYKKGDIDGSVKFFDEALAQETDNVKKADICYKAATVLSAEKRLSMAKSYIQKSISFNPEFGQPYLLLATMYAGNNKWNDEPILNKCVFYVAVDKLQKAKSVDPSLAEEANKLIASYSSYFPEAKDLFMLGYKSGDRLTIGGWINETTTIR